MKTGEQVTPRGIRESVHVCETCGVSFSVAPCVEDEDAHLWPDCLAPGCPSYDPSRDVLRLASGAD